MKRLILAALLSVGCGGAPAPTPPPAAPVASPEAAAQAFDAALIAALDGDALDYETKLVRLAADHPRTRHGRTALRRVGGDGGLVAYAFLLTGAASAGFLMSLLDPGETAARSPRWLERLGQHLNAPYPAVTTRTTPRAPACAPGADECR